MPLTFQPYDLVRIQTDQYNELAVVTPAVRNQHPILVGETSHEIEVHDPGCLTHLLSGQQAYLDQLLDQHGRPTMTETPEHRAEPLAATDGPPDLLGELGEPDWSINSPSDGRDWVSCLSLWSGPLVASLFHNGPDDLDPLEELLALMTPAQRAVFIRIQNDCQHQVYRLGGCTQVWR